jgi:hypothetical protein
MIVISFNVFLTPQEVHTIMRKLDHNKDGKLDVKEMYNFIFTAAQA